MEDGEVHGDDQAANQHAEDSHDHRLHQGGEAIDGVVHFRFIEASNLVEHFIQCPGLLADGGHLHGHGGEDAGGAHGEVQLHAGGDVGFNLEDGVFEDHVAAGTGDRIQGVH
ncbi:hypothetical protein D9M69_491580 [compost metagenome]